MHGGSGLFIPIKSGNDTAENVSSLRLSGWRCYVQAQAKSIALILLIQMKTPRHQSERSSGDFFMVVNMEAFSVILISLSAIWSFGYLAISSKPYKERGYYPEHKVFVISVRIFFGTLTSVWIYALIEFIQ